MRETGKSRSETRDTATFELKQIRVTEATGVGIVSLAVEPRIAHPNRVRRSDKSNIATAARAEQRKEAARI